MSPIGDWLAEAQQADFTGRQAQLDLFRVLLPLDRQKVLPELGEDTRQRVQSLIPLKRLASLVVLGIHGIGGIGKSRLLAQFQALTEEYDEESDRLKWDEPVLMVRLDLQSHKGILDFLTAIYEQLSPRMEFPNFEAGLKLRQEIEDRLRKSENIPKGTLQTLSRGISSLIKGMPFIGEPIAEMLASPEQVEAAISTIYGVVGRKEGDFWMKPEEELTNRLLADLQPISEKYRFVLMFDTYELIGTFDEWVRERLLPKLGERTLIVLAGRDSLEGRGWQKYSSLMWQLELPLFSHHESRQYLERKGVTDTQVATNLADRTDGHPLILSMFAELAAQGEVTGIDMTRSAEGKRVIQQLLKTIKERVAENLREALEVCAILRVVNEDNLAYMLDQADVAAIFDQVRAFDFIKVRSDGIALHDTVWVAMNEELNWRSPAHYRELNAKAMQFYEQALAAGTASDRSNYELELLYHRIRADEVSGITAFQNMAEELVRNRFINRLQALVNDIDSYANQFSQENSRLWLKYYIARLEHLENHRDSAANVYRIIDKSEHAEPKLRAYALCDLGEIMSPRSELEDDEGGLRVISILHRSLNQGVELDPKLIQSLWTLGEVHRRLGDAETGSRYYQQAIELIEKGDDEYTGTRLRQYLIIRYLYEGYSALFDYEQLLAEKAEVYKKHPMLKVDFKEAVTVPLIWMGRYSQSEDILKSLLNEMTRIREFEYWWRDRQALILRTLTYVKAMQGNIQEAEVYFTEAVKVMKDFQLNQHTGSVLGFYGIGLLRNGKLEEAEDRLTLALQSKITVRDLAGVPELLTWLGTLHEIRAISAANNIQMSQALDNALDYYLRPADPRSRQSRPYFECGTVVGLIRVKHAQQQYASIPPLLTQAEQLAQQYEYNDHLASLRLTQGHIAWDGHIEEWGSGFEAALGYYKQALVYALRFNRFLLYEALSGREHGTPLRPIIPHCLERGEEGRKMLEALAEWWHTGTNDIGTPRPDTISPIPEGILLLEAERLARSREPGDGSPQRLASEQILNALA
ncbi:MAG TPA: hypothetical protein VJ183_16985 [Chloroflexia bacterium]|nr:hypothetical protein [Chloroflexia bacterium]